MNPTRLPISVFIDHIPLVRALAFGVTDGYPRAHYPAVRTHKESGHPDFADAQPDPHDVFLHPRYAITPEVETDEARAAGRDPDHRAAALDAIAPEVAAAFAEVQAAEAEAAGLCPAWLWSDETIPAIAPEVQAAEAEATRGETVVRLGVRSILAARAAASNTPAEEPPAEEPPAAEADDAATPTLDVS